MANRFGRRRIDGIFEYSDSLEELQSSASQEDEEHLKEILALIGLVLGATMMYVLIGRHVPDWPKVLRFALILGGASLCGVVCASSAVVLRTLLPICFTLGVLGGFGYLLWLVLW